MVKLRMTVIYVRPNLIASIFSIAFLYLYPNY